MKVGNIVRIINPEVLIRVGYPETRISASEKLDQQIFLDHGKQFNDLMRETFSFLDYKELSTIQEAVSSAYMRKVLKFGGDNKEVYTNYDPELLDKYAQIVDRKVKYSGTHTKRSGTRKRNYLTNPVAHVFYRIVERDISHQSTGFLDQHLYCSSKSKGTWIEKKNLEFIRED